MKIGKDLKNIVMHTMQLEELWEQRESQLDRNKRLSTQFFEFEKEIRKVLYSYFPNVGKIIKEAARGGVYF